MKKKYFFLALILAVVQGMAVQAQTDVTSTYLKNAGFDEAPICYTVAGGTVLNAKVTRIGTTGWVFPIPQWRNESVINANAVQVASGEYGTVANAQGFNNVPVPATDRYGSSAGAAISMSAGWGDKANYAQDVILPGGRYILKVDVYNGHTPTKVISNFVGFIPLDGTAAYSKRVDFPSGVWVTDSVDFFVADDAIGKINLGYTTSSGGSGNGPKFFLDNVKLYYFGIDKTALKALIDSAAVMKANPQDVGTATVYQDLDGAIAAAQAIYDKVTAKASEVLEQETLLKAAIAKVHDAILLQTRVKTWTTLPYNATSAIKNPGFESIFEDGWVNEGLFARQTNTSFDPFKIGTYYAERWIAGPGALENLRISQVVRNIPNGTYLVTASAHSIQQASNTYPGGAYLIGNGAVTEIFDRKDYSVIAEVMDNTLELGIEVALTGNWIAFDNFRLSYISDGTPYLVPNAEQLNFTPTQTAKSFVLTGGNLTGDVTLTTSSSFQLSKSTLTAQEVMLGAEVTVNALATQAIKKDSIVIAHGDVKKVVYLGLSEKLDVTRRGFFFDQSLTTERAFDVIGDLYGNVTISAPEGLILSATSLTKAEALNTTTVLLLWDGATRIEDKYIYVNSGSVKDSIRVFAVNDNIISTWDGDNAEGDGSLLTNFGWSLMMNDGITPVAGAFNPFAATSGIRYVLTTNQNYVYNGKPWQGGRLAYLRTWGDPPTNVYNLSVNLEQGKTYAFRGVASWHDNETNPTFTIGVNSAMSNTGDTLAIQSKAFSVKRTTADYKFTIQPKTTGMHYLTISSNVKGDVMISPLYLAIYETVITSTPSVNDGAVKVYPTLTSSQVTIETGGKAGNVQVYDLTGKMAVSAMLSGDSQTLNLPGEGAYILKVRAGSETKTVKVICVK